MHIHFQVVEDDSGAVFPRRGALELLIPWFKILIWLACVCNPKNIKNYKNPQISCILLARSYT
jgi:hypothetical protein